MSAGKPINSIRKSIFPALLLISGLGLCFSLPGSAPDYADLHNWAAHPYKHDPSDTIPAFLKNEERDTSADVFFLHPTTFTDLSESAPMNADLTDTALNRSTDMRTILLQASIFNGSARVFAPRYRQANFKVFLELGSQRSNQALDLAYGDIRKAFQYYLAHWNKGRPIIIAGHSQGSLLAIRLLKEFFDGKPLQKQLVCAYIPGWQIKKTDLKYIPFGSSPGQTGCVLGWRTFLRGKTPTTPPQKDTVSLCVNPISWTTDTTSTTRDMHKGLVSRNINFLIPHLVTTAISSDYRVLWVSGIRNLPADNDNPIINKMLQSGNLHIADFNLFYMDVRENVKLRVKNYLSNNKN